MLLFYYKINFKKNLKIKKKVYVNNELTKSINIEIPKIIIKNERC